MLQKVQTVLSTPSTERSLPSDEFVELIKVAQKTDHQFYHKEQLTPVGFGLNAKLPSLTNLLNLPFELKDKISSLFKYPCPKNSKPFYYSLVEVFSQSINLSYSLLQPFLFLGTFTALIFRNIHFALAANITAFLYAFIEIGKNLWNLYHDHQLSKVSSLDLIHHYKLFDTSISPEEALSHLSKMLTTLDSHHQFISEDTFTLAKTTLKTLQRELKTQTTHFFEAQERFLPLWERLEYELILNKMQNIETQFFKFSPEEKEEQIMIAKHLYQQKPYSEALFQSLNLVQSRFKEKKLLLADRVRPWLATHLINSHHQIMEQLQDTKAPDSKVKGIEEAKKYLERLHLNSQIKQKVDLINIALFSIVMISAILSFISFANPIVTGCIIALSSILYYSNMFRISGIMDNPNTNSIAWSNCLPPWVTIVQQKLHAYFYPIEKAKPISHFHIKPIHSIKPACL